MHSRTRIPRSLTALSLAAVALLTPALAAQEPGTTPEPPPAPVAAPASPGQSGGDPSSDVATGGGKLPPGLAKLLRKGPPLSPVGPPNGPQPGKSPPDPDDPYGAGNRGWELWWELHRDRYVEPRPRDLTLAVGRIPPDPRTSVQSVGSLVGSYERVEPSLRLILAHERSDIVLARALVALAKLGEDPRAPGSRTTYATILPYLYHSDAELSEAAITALGILGTEDALFPLADLALGPRREPGSRDAAVTDRQRALALYAIGMIGRDSSREDVRRLAASRITALFAKGAPTSAPPSAEVRFAAMHALSLVPLCVAPPKPAESLEPRRGRRAWHRRTPSTYPRVEVRPIPSASRAAEVDWLLAVLDDPREEGWIRAQAATAAGRLCADLPDGSPIEAKVAARLLAALAPRSKDGIEVEQSAVLALGEFADGDKDELDARVRATLATALAEADDASVREFAYVSLALVGSRPGGDASEPDRLCASGDVRRLLLERAASVRAIERPWAVLALGLLERGLSDAGVAGAPEARAALATTLAEARSADLAAAASLAAGLAGATEASAELIERLGDGDVRVRRSAALALGLLRAREAAPAIERLLAEARAEPELYRDAGEALALLGAPVGRQLLGMMKEGASLEAQMNLCTALGRVGDGSSLRALSRVACDDTALIWVRAAATSALGNLGTRRPTPWNADFGHALNFHWTPPTLSAGSLDGILDLD